MTPYLIAAAAVALGATLGWLRWRLRIITVIGDSMRPTLTPGDRLLVRRTPLARVRTGDIVVLTYPERGDVFTDGPPGFDLLVKRAIATAGDPVPALVAPALSVRPGTPVRDGALIVVGDNTDISYDSRVFGYVLADDLIGVVLRRIHVHEPVTASAPATVPE
jgi:signal peptidase I